MTHPHPKCDLPFWRDPRALFGSLAYRPTCQHSAWNFIARILLLSIVVGLLASYFAGLPSLAVALLFGSLTAYAIVSTTATPPCKATAQTAHDATPSGTPIKDFHALPFVQGAHAAEAEGIVAPIKEHFINGGAAVGSVQPVLGVEEVDAHPYAGPSLPDYTPPTSRNLFMNILLDEQKYNPTRPAAASVDHPLVKQTMDDFFRVQWFSDPTDVFGKSQGQRQFITMPSTTVPNDQGSFADWLYRIPGKTCKEGGRDACMGGTNGHIPWLSH
jgi:hypothetical protein